MNNISKLISLIKPFNFHEKQLNLLNYMMQLNLDCNNEYSYFLISAVIRESVDQMFQLDSYTSLCLATNQDVTDYRCLYSTQDCNDEKIKSQSNFKKWMFLKSLSVSDDSLFKKIKDNYKKICGFVHLNINKTGNASVLYEDIASCIEDFTKILLQDILKIESYINDISDTYWYDQTEIISELTDIGSGHHDFEDIHDCGIVKDSLKIALDCISFKIHFSISSTHHLGCKNDGFNVSSNLNCKQEITSPISIRAIIANYLNDHISESSFEEYIHDNVIPDYQRGRLVTDIPSFYQ